MKTKKGATLVGSLFAITILSTTLVSALNLQASISKAKFFLQYDNTANLLVAEGLEIVRFLHAASPIKNPSSDAVYAVDHETSILPTTANTDCTDADANSTCDLAIPTLDNPTLDNPTLDKNFILSTTTAQSIFYRFIKIESGENPTVTSTVIVINPQNNSTRTYKAVMKLYTN